MLEKILEDTEQLINMHYEDDSVKFLILKKNLTRDGKSDIL